MQHTIVRTLQSRFEVCDIGYRLRRYEVKEAGKCAHNETFWRNRQDMAFVR